MPSVRSKQTTRLMEVQESLPKIISPIVRLLKASGVSDAEISKATAVACREHSNERVRGISIDLDEFCQLADVVMVWARDPEFIDESGLPKKLWLSSSKPSFQRLMSKSGVAINTTQAMKYLLKLDSVRLCDGNRKARLVSHVLLSVTPRRFVVSAVLDEIRRFVETIEHNVCERPEGFDGRMQRTVLCDSLDPDKLSEAQRFIRQNAQSFLDALDEKLSTCRSKGTSRRLRYGAGIYVFVDKQSSKL